MKNLYLACKKTHLADSILLDWTLPMSFLSEIRLNLMTLGTVSTLICVILIIPQLGFLDKRQRDVRLLGQSRYVSVRRSDLIQYQHQKEHA